MFFFSFLFMKPSNEYLSIILINFRYTEILVSLHIILGNYIVLFVLY